jgi:perosamine synthetase
MSGPAPGPRRIPACEPYLAGREAEYVRDCLSSNWISSAGKYLPQFEAGFARYCGCEHGIATTSGTTALHLAIAARGLRPGDEIIMPTFTIAATVFAALYAGATPVLVDVEPDTWTMRVDQVAAKVGPRTRAILPVHMYGHPCDMDPLRELAKRHDLWVLEDAAEAHGAEYKGRKCGSLGDAACFSFYANKIITTGEGGMVVTNDAALAERCRSLKNLGFNRDRRFLHDAVGFNYRMTNVQAAIGLAQLENVDQYVALRRRHGASYTALLRDVEGLRLPVERPWARNAYWMYGIVVEDGFGCSRDDLRTGLAERGVETRTFFIPMHEQPVFHQQDLFCNEHYPVASDLGRRGLYLPSSTGLTDADLAYVVDAVRDVQRVARSRALVSSSAPRSTRR